ncbi:7455_t:CDS:2, partial [Racocetra fulgida]
MLHLQIPYDHSVAFDHLFEASIFSKDEILKEFRLENIQESVNDLDDLIDNTTVNDLDDLIDNTHSISIMINKSSSLNQDSNIETQSNLVNDSDNHKNQDTITKIGYTYLLE